MNVQIPKLYESIYICQGLIKLKLTHVYDSNISSAFGNIISLSLMVVKYSNEPWAVYCFI